MRSYPSEIPAVVLVDEREVTVEEDGRVTIVERGAVRVLTREGRRAAVAKVRYSTDTGKVRDFEGWLMRPGGDVKRYGKDLVVDVLAAPNDVYNESRLQRIEAADDAEPGAVFAYQWTLKDRSVFLQFDWTFQGRNPALSSSFSVVLPAGWRAEAVTFNRGAIAPVILGSRTTWELSDLPYIADEPASPSVSALAPRLAVSILPPAGRPSDAATFRTWSEVSRWLTELSDSGAPAAAVAAKARELTAAAKTPWDRILAIARFVQSLNYISVQTGVGRGGGYRPHAPADVLAKGFGDCKDKANLVRALLRAIDVPAYLVSLTSGDRTYVREEWPSPQQFDHCIVALRAPEGADAPAALETKLGRILVFDPTDPSTPLGSLPDGEQGSLALIEAGADGVLVRLPRTSPEANLLHRTADVSVLLDGSIRVDLTETATGSMASRYRAELRSRSRPEYDRILEGWLARAAAGAKISKAEPKDEDGGFGLVLTYSAPHHAQVMDGKLLVVRPSVLPPVRLPHLTERKRTLPIVLEPLATNDTIVFKMPVGYSIDELPEAVSLDAPFGTYCTRVEAKEDRVTLKHSLLIRAATLPPSEVSNVQEFFRKLKGAEDAPIVLKKSGAP